MSGRPFGKTPDHWEVTTLGRLGRFLKGFGGSKEDDVGAGVPCVRYGDLYAFHGEFITGTRSFIDPAKAEGYAPVQAGDVLFAASGETLDEIGKSAANLLAEKAVVGGDVIVLRPTRPVNHRFLGYACQSEPVALQKTRAGKGVTVMHIYPAGLRNVKIAIPPLGEQDAIVRYLDHVDSRIQRLIAAKERLIELLEEEKQALIHRAVTRGLDPNVTLKRSGVDWLGDVPAHWELRKLQELTNPSRPIIYGIVLPGPDLPEGVPIVKGGNCEPGKLQLRNLAKTDFEIARRHARSRLEARDIVIAIRGGVGAAEVVPPELSGANLTQDAARISPRSGVETKWLLAVLRSSFFQQHVRARIRGATVTGINIRDLRRIQVPVPPPGEQAVVGRYVAARESEIGKAASRAHRQISLLREYRMRLISDVVTGKLDVREAAAELPDDPGAADPRVDEQLEEAMAG